MGQGNFEICNPCFATNHARVLGTTLGSKQVDIGVRVITIRSPTKQIQSQRKNVNLQFNMSYNSQCAQDWPYFYPYSISITKLTYLFTKYFKSTLSTNYFHLCLLYQYKIQHTVFQVTDITQSNNTNTLHLT